MSRYCFIDEQRSQYPVRLLCQVVAVPASGYYLAKQAQQPTVAPPEPAWETALVQVFGIHKRYDGTRRLQVALRKKGHRVGRQRLLLKKESAFPAPQLQKTAWNDKVMQLELFDPVGNCLVLAEVCI